MVSHTKARDERVRTAVDNRDRIGIVISYVDVAVLLAERQGLRLVAHTDGPLDLVSVQNRDSVRTIVRHVHVIIDRIVS
jgi:hypothetical protein